MLELGSLFLALALLLVVALYVGRPLLERRSVSVSEQDREVSALLAERDRILDALQELDFDHALGKIPSDEYPAQRARLLKRGADALRDLDQLQASEAEATAEDRLEAAIAARRADTGKERPPVPPDDPLETMIAARRRERSEKAAGFCPGCGQPVGKSDRFCARCGTTLD